MEKINFKIIHISSKLTYMSSTTIKLLRISCSLLIYNDKIMIKRVATRGSTNTTTKKRNIYFYLRF